MNRRTFLILASAVPLSLERRALARPTNYPTCTCGHFEPGPHHPELDLIQCEHCRAWLTDQAVRSA